MRLWFVWRVSPENKALSSTPEFSFIDFQGSSSLRSSCVKMAHLLIQQILVCIFIPMNTKETILRQSQDLTELLTKMQLLEHF